MATHIEELSVRLRQTLSELVKPELLSSSCETLELDPSSQPRVVIIGSASGGTCSGMGIDLAYLSRSILRQLGVLEEDVVGIFTHSATAASGHRELAVANTLAFLSELYHFSCVEEYPGDASCGIDASTDGTTTFASTYLVQLGDDLPKTEWETQLDRIAEYVYLGTVSPCASWLDKCREQEADQDGLPIRSLGLCRSNRFDQIQELTATLRVEVVGRWMAGRFTKFDPAEAAQDVLQGNIGTIERMVRLVHKSVGKVIEKPVATISSRLLRRFNANEREATKQNLQRVAEEIFGFELEPGAAPPKLLQATRLLCQRFAEDVPHKIRTQLEAIIEAPGHRLIGASEVARQIDSKLDESSEQIARLIESTHRDIGKRYAFLVRPEGPTQEEGQAFVGELVELLFQLFTLQTIQEMNDSLKKSTEGLQEKLDHISELLGDAIDRHMRQEPVLEQPKLDPTPNEAFESALSERATNQLAMLAQRVEQQFQCNMLDLHGGFEKALEDEESRTEFAAQLDEAARATIVEHLKELQHESFYGEMVTASGLAEEMARRARPKIVECGGSLRWLHAYPGRSQPNSKLVERLTALAGAKPNLIPATFGELVVCVEAEQIPVENVVIELLQNRPDSIEFASRLHTRTDINWAHISSMR